MSVRAPAVPVTAKDPASGRLELAASLVAVSQACLDVCFVSAIVLLVLYVTVLLP